jgi:hypothetical protein
MPVRIRLNENRDSNQNKSNIIPGFMANQSQNLINTQITADFTGDLSFEVLK